MQKLLAILLILSGIVAAWQADPPRWRLAGVGVALLGLAWLVTVVLGWFHGPRYRRLTRARMFYVGAHPLLRTRRWVTATATPEGLTIDIGWRYGRVTLKYGQLQQTTVRQHTGWRCLDFFYRDLISKREYSMGLAVLDNGNYAPDELHGAIERWIYGLADVKWALWRGLNLPLPITADERRVGGERDFFYIRQAACPACGGNEGYNLACRQCAGKGAMAENAYAKVKIPKRSRIGQQIVIEGGGNEDLNGNHGPLILRLVDAKDSGASRSAVGNPPKTKLATEPRAARKGPVDLNDLLPTGRTGPVDINGHRPRDINGVGTRDVNGLTATFR